jgi:hypothetical protein
MSVRDSRITTRAPLHILRSTVHGVTPIYKTSRLRRLCAVAERRARFVLARLRLDSWNLARRVARPRLRDSSSRPVARLAVLCPGGIGRQKLRIVFTVLALRACGAWGKRRLAEKLFGRRPANASPATKAFMGFTALIHEHFRPRMAKLPVFLDTSLRRLTVPKAEVTLLPDAGHVITGHTERVVRFLIGVRGGGGNH